MNGENKVVLCQEAMLEVANYWVNAKIMQSPKVTKVTYSPKTKMFTFYTKGKS